MATQSGNVLKNNPFDKNYFEGAVYKKYEYDEHYENFIIPALKYIEILNKDICNLCGEKNHIKKILDTGCAKGFYIKALKKYKKQFASWDLELHGIDISEYAINNADPEAVANVMLGNVLDIPFKDKYFDLVLCKDTIEHVSLYDADKAIDELCRVSARYIIISFMVKKMEWDKDYTHLNIQNIDYWIEKFKSRGFMPVEARFNDVGYWEPVVLFKRKT